MTPFMCFSKRLAEPMHYSNILYTPKLRYTFCFGLFFLVLLFTTFSWAESGISETGISEDNTQTESSTVPSGSVSEISEQVEPQSTPAPAVSSDATSTSTDAEYAPLPAPVPQPTEKMQQNAPITINESGTNIIYFFNGTNISEQDAQILTTKLTNLLVQHTKQTFYYASQWGSNNSTTIPDKCLNRETANNVINITGVTRVIWGEIGRINETFLCSVYRVTNSTPQNMYEVFQEEISGGLNDVLKYAIYNLAMKMTGQADRIISKPVMQQERAPVVTQTTNQPYAEASTGRGWLKITVPDNETELFLDGQSIGKGSCEVEAPVGEHGVMARSHNKVETKFVEIRRNGLSTVSFDDVVEEEDSEETDGRVVRFYMSFDASWMLGDDKEFGPSHMVGIEIKKKHLLAINYYWGLPLFDNYLFGGGMNYMFTFNIHDIFLARLGGCFGFWYESIYDYDYYDDYYYSSSYYYDDYYYDENVFFGGPRFRIEIGHKNVFYITDGTLLLGSGVKPLLNSGISFRF